MQAVVRIWGGATLNWSRVRPLTDTGGGGEGGDLPQPVTLMSAVARAPPAQYNPERLGDPSYISHRLLVQKIFLDFLEKLYNYSEFDRLGVTGTSADKKIFDPVRVVKAVYLFFGLSIYLSSIYPFKTEPGQVEFKIERYVRLTKIIQPFFRYSSN